MNKIAFVILHYETIIDTKKCIESLVKYIDSNKAYIVVVDNGSKKGKLDELKIEYSLNKHIIFLRSEINLGFANGNNLGFEYAKNKLGANFIVLTNSDTVFEQNNFVSMLENLYEKQNFDIAGPKIISMADGKNQNPVKKIYDNRKDLKKRLLKFRILMLLSYINIDVIIKNYLSKDIIEFQPIASDDIQLHGACLIFTQNYINNYSGLYEKTFMYGEESILKYISERDNLKMVYLDELQVYHKEGSSTNAIYGEGRKKRQFYYKWNIKSCKILNNLMKDS